MQQTTQLEEMEACAEAGMSFAEYAALPGDQRWVDPANPTMNKSAVLIWYRLHNLLRAIPQDIAARDTMRKRRFR